MRERDEAHGRKQPAHGMLPAQQGLAGHDPPCGIHLRLHMQAKLRARQGLLQLMLQRQPVFHLLLHGVLEEGDAVAPGRLGAVHGGVGLAHQVADVLAGLGEEADADAARARVAEVV
jgi:hypothetical protein